MGLVDADTVAVYGGRNAVMFMGAYVGYALQSDIYTASDFFFDISRSNWFHDVRARDSIKLLPWHLSWWLSEFQSVIIENRYCQYGTILISILLVVLWKAEDPCVNFWKVLPGAFSSKVLNSNFKLSKNQLLQSIFSYLCSERRTSREHFWWMAASHRY